MWFSDLVCTSEDESELVLRAGSEFNAVWVENNFLEIIEQQVHSLAGAKVKVLIEAKPQETPPNSQPSRVKNDRIEKSPLRTNRNNYAAFRSDSVGSSEISSKNTFENFVVGNGSQLAHAASIAVANAPGRSYNPLFLFGETGLGKTHLMHAVAHQMLINNPNTRISYISTEKFTNQYINAIRAGEIVKFRKYYRNVDALLIDDIHFLSGKESTQEEFFHTFNDLFEMGCQIFLASDRPATEIKRLEDRLISRFQWGLVTDIQMPDFETRLAILKNKALAIKLSLSEEIMEFLAKHISRNVRRMEGALNLISAYSHHSHLNHRLDLASVEELLSDLLHEEAKNQLSIEQIQHRVVDYYKIQFKHLVGRRRTNEIVVPRQVAMYLCRELTGDSLLQIAQAFNRSDHGTVMHACKQVKERMDQDCSLKRAVHYLIRELSKRNV